VKGIFLTKKLVFNKICRRIRFPTQNVVPGVGVGRF
jgi:hypothetical protein